jgi:ABC-2 type transport system permease protein
VSRPDPILPNTAIIARREYRERVASRLFVLTTILLASLAAFVALAPLMARAVDRGAVTRIAVVTADDDLAQRAVGILDPLLNSTGTDYRPFDLIHRTEVDAAVGAVADGDLAAAIVLGRKPDGGLAFGFHAGDTIGDEKLALLSTALFGVAFLDYVALNPGGGFSQPTIDVLRATGGGGPAASVSSAEFASRRIVAIVLVFLTFLILVIYGMWVAAGVVGEKASRVMEVMISAASARQLVFGKVIGIGAAGLTQALLVIAPALFCILIEDRLATALFGPGPSLAPSLSGLSVGLLGAFAVYFVLGFLLYALVFAAAGSLVSRAEDLQMLALPLNIVAIGGFFVAILAMTGGAGGIIRIASLVPFWSPFAMLTRVAIGRASATEVALSLVLLVGAIAVMSVVAVRVYAAGVLLYGQRPGLRQIVAAVVESR